MNSVIAHLIYLSGFIMLLQIQFSLLLRKVSGTSNSYIYCYPLDAGLNPSDIRCIGLSTQRATFTTWDRRTGVTFHNFITWKDMRADALVRHWNSCLTMKVSCNLCNVYLNSKDISERKISNAKLLYVDCKKQIVCLSSNDSLLGDAILNKEIKLIFNLPDNQIWRLTSLPVSAKQEVSCSKCCEVYECSGQWNQIKQCQLSKSP